MKSITNIEKTTLPAIRRTDEVVEKRNEARREIAATIAGLSRAEIGIIARVGMNGTSLYEISGAVYYDGYSVDEGRFVGSTRRLSDAAQEKALRSLVEKGIIRIEGAAPRKTKIRWSTRGIEGDLVGLRYQDGEAGNSGIRIDSDGDVYESGGDRGTVTSQQYAVWYVRSLFDGDLRRPGYWVGGYMTAAVRVVLADSLVEALRRNDEADLLVDRVRMIRHDVERIEDVEVAEIIKPEPYDLYNAVTGAFFDARREGEDVGGIYDAMNRALDEFREAAKYGAAPKNSVTPEEYVAIIARLTRGIEIANAKIEEVIA
jgi:hypothetical protein